MTSTIKRLCVSALFASLCLSGCSKRDERPSTLERELQPSTDVLGTWLVLGPISKKTAKPRPYKSAFELDYLERSGGEANVRPVAGAVHVLADGTELRWTKTTIEGPGRFKVWRGGIVPKEKVVDFLELFRAHSDKSQRTNAGAKKPEKKKPKNKSAKKERPPPIVNSVAYAYTTFTTERAQSAYLMMGNDDTVHVWLNGKLVHETDGSDYINHDTIPVDLLKGSNHLLVKADQPRGQWFFTVRVATESQALPKATDGDDFLKYGKRSYSRYREDVIVRHFFKDRREGVFLDVGASHFEEESNTYYLEKSLGWSGVAIDALAEYAAGYEQSRPKTKFLAYAVTDQDGGEITFLQRRNRKISSLYESKIRPNDRYEEITVPKATLNTLLEQQSINKVDFMSMDIELAEPAALAGFDIDRFKPELVCIEAHPPVRKEIVAYFKEHWYKRVDHYLPFDPINWYYTPMSAEEIEQTKAQDAKEAKEAKAKASSEGASQ